VKLATGSAGYLLLVSGHEADIRNSSILSCGRVLVGSVILIPTYGLTGAAMASALALAGMSLMDMVFVYLRLKVVLLPG
jgi:O-antigen/teichoic acid export membrane protein